MKRTLTAVAVMLFALTARADQQSIYRIRGLLDDLGRITTDLAKEANRDAEILRRLTDAARALDDWQKNNGVSRALDAIGKAEQLAAQWPLSPRVQKIVKNARDIVQPAHDSPMNIDQMKLRGELRGRAIEPMRQIVSEDIGALARVTSQLTDVTNVIAKAMASASVAALGQTE
jgi:lipopolysaccharide biosynthesis regulator YciM